MLALSDAITTCLFDLDGVLAQTAKIHAQAWEEMFDDFLRDWSERAGEPFEPFDRPTDYDEYVDGKPRLDGVRSFRQSRGIELPMGSPSDPPEAETVHALGPRKNERVLALIRGQGVEPYEGSVRFAEAARDQGLRRAVVSSSTNCRDVLVAAGIDHLFEARVDGVVEREQLAGNPAPDMFVAGARMLDAEPRQAAVFEEALAGVEAGRAGGFRLGRPRRPQRSGRGAAPPRRRRRRAGARGAAVIGQEVFAVEPWAVAEHGLDLELLRRPSRSSRSQRPREIAVAAPSLPAHRGPPRDSTQPLRDAACRARATDPRRARRYDGQDSWQHPSEAVAPDSTAGPPAQVRTRERRCPFAGGEAVRREELLPLAPTVRLEGA